jgi:hypothetical protein
MVKRCRVCRRTFAPRNSLHRVCSVECSIAFASMAEATTLRRQADRQAKREFRERTESKGQARRKAQAAFNSWVRFRDAGRPCISCGAMPDPKRGGTMDAGHYRSTGACPQLRFDPDNCHLQCVRCNRDLSGNAIAYRVGLVRRIGVQRLARLEADHPLPKWGVAEYREIARMYRAWLAEARRGDYRPDDAIPLRSEGYGTKTAQEGAHDAAGHRTEQGRGWNAHMLPLRGGDPDGKAANAQPVQQTVVPAVHGVGALPAA